MKHFDWKFEWRKGNFFHDSIEFELFELTTVQDYPFVVLCLSLEVGSNRWEISGQDLFAKQFQCEDEEKAKAIAIKYAIRSYIEIARDSKSYIRSLFKARHGDTE